MNKTRVTFEKNTENLMKMLVKKIYRIPSSYGALDLFWNQILGRASPMCTVVCRFFSVHSGASLDPAIVFVVFVALGKVS